MPNQFEDLLSKLRQANNDNSTNGFDPNLVGQSANTPNPNSFGSLLDNLRSGNVNTTFSYDPNKLPFDPNPKYNTSDTNYINVGKQATIGGWNDWWNDLYRSIDEIQIATSKGKLEYDWDNLAPNAVIDEFPDRMKDLDSKLKTGRISPDAYEREKTRLTSNLNKAYQDRSSLLQDIQENEQERDDNVISAERALNKLRVQNEGVDASNTDKFLYSLPSLIGGSASLMIPQMAATFAANFARTAATTAALEAFPGIGTVGQGIISTTAGIAAAIGPVLYGRAQESYAEVSGTIDTVRQQLEAEYRATHGLSQSDPIPEEDARKIRIQSRVGAKEQFNENMALAASDVAQAVLLPLNNFGKALRIGNIGTESIGLINKAKNTIEAVKNYNTMTRVLNTLGKAYFVSKAEGFEEGLQYAAGKRAEAKALGLDEYENKGFLTNLLTDSWDTASSMSYSFLPGSSLRGNGRYSQDSEFLLNEEGGSFLGVIMGAIPNAISIGKEIQRYRNAKSDLIKNGLLDDVGKFGRINASILKNYFERNQTPYLIEAIRNLKDKTDENGDPILTQEEATVAINNIRDSYEQYQSIKNTIDTIPKDKFFTWSGSKNFKKAKEGIKEDLFNSVLSINTRERNASELEDLKAQELTRQNLFNEDNNLNNYTDLIAQQLAVDELKNSYYEALKDKDLNSQISKTHLEDLEETSRELSTAIKEESDRLREAGTFNEDVVPTRNLIDLNKNLVVNELHLNTYKNIYKELSRLRTARDVFDYAQKNRNRSFDESSEFAETAQQADEPATDETEVSDATTLNEDVFNQNNDDLNNQAENEVVDTTLNPDETIDQENEPVEDTVNEEYRPLNDDLKALATQELMTIFDPSTTPALKPQLVDSFVKNYTNTDISKTPLDIIYQQLQRVVPTDLLKNLFPELKSIVTSQQVNNPTLYNVSNGTTVDNLGNIHLKDTSNIPVSFSTDELNNKNKEVEEKLVSGELHQGSGNKITDPLSLATSQVEFERINGKIYNKRDSSGQVLFKNSGDDQHLTNTNLVAVNDDLSIVIDSIPDDFDFDNTTDENYDKIEIKVYKKINTGKNISKNFLLGYYHKVTSLDNLMVAGDIISNKNILRAQRREVIQAYRDGQTPDFSIKVTDKKMGYVNMNSSFTTIGNASIGDDRVYMSIIDNSGYAVTIENGYNIPQYSSTGDYIRGAVVVMVPNETNEGTVYIPMYVQKSPLSSDPNIFNKVFNALKKFDKTKANKDLPGQYLYTTKDREKASSLGRNGVFIEVNPNTQEAVYWINDKPYSFTDPDSLSKALGSVFPNVDKASLNDPNYQNEIKNSQLFKTNITKNTQLNNYPFLGIQANQYFSQHTITFSGVQRNVVAIPTIESRINNNQGEIEIPFIESEESIEQDIMSQINLPEPEETQFSSEKDNLRNMIQELESQTTVPTDPLYGPITPELIRNLELDLAFTEDRNYRNSLSNRIKELKEKLNNSNIDSNDTSAEDNLEDAGISFDDIVVTSENTPSVIVSKTLVNPAEISISLQNQMVDSVAYMLLNNPVEQGKTNSESVRDRITRNIEVLRTNVDKLKDPSTKLKAGKGLLNNILLLENFNGILAKAQDVLRGLGFRPNADNEYYENLEEFMEDNNVTQFNDDSNRTFNAVEFLPSDVKRLLYFLPELVDIDPNNERDVKLMGETGKNYKPKNNELGYPSFNDFTDSWSKLLTVISEYHYEPTIEGFNSMLEDMSNNENAPIIRELAQRLQGRGYKGESLPISEQTRNTFFRKVYLQNQKNRVALITLKNNKITEEYFGQITTTRGEVSTTSIINPNRKQGVKQVTEELKTEFKLSKSGIITTTTNEDDRTTYIIDTNKGKDILDRVSTVVNSDESYQLNPRTGKITKFLTESAVTNLHSLINEAGINISLSAFQKFLNTYKTDKSQVQSPRAAMNEVFINGILNTLAGIGGVENPTAFNQNNPFESNSSFINKLAKYEYSFRKERQSGAYRTGGKSYYPFVRHHYLSEIISKIKNEINVQKTVNGNPVFRPGSFIKDKLLDVFAKGSRYLGLLRNRDRNFLRNFDMYYELGTSNRVSTDENKLLKDMSVREHQIVKLKLYQNSGNLSAMFLYDTLSDKTGKPILNIPRLDIAFDGKIDTGLTLSDETLEALYVYYQAEQDRIQEVIKQNELLPSEGRAHELIKGYHDIGAKEGMGKRFLIYEFLNKEMLDLDNPTLSRIMYDNDGRLRDLSENEEVKSIIKLEINKRFNDILRKNKGDLKALDIFTFETNNNKRVVDISSLVDHNYIKNGTKNNPSVLDRLGIPENDTRSFRKTGNTDSLSNDQIESIIDYTITDYVINYAIFSNEWLMITGDPAQAGKQAGSAVKNAIKADPSNKENPTKLKRDLLLADIIETHINVGKRNAALVGSGEKGLFDSPTYNVAIANDININSGQIGYYLSLFPSNKANVEAAYQDGDLTDAQEITTVKEDLAVRQAYGSISPDMAKKALFILDRRAYNKLYKEPISVSQEEKDIINKLPLQPVKPVQRTSVIDRSLGISKQYYIKTSSYPLIPSLVKDTPLEDLLNDMIDKNIDRIPFVTGVKQGVAGAKNIFDKEGNYNTEFLTNNINTLDRDGFRIQLEVPYEEGKQAIRESTQLSKMLFVDIPDTLEVVYNNKNTSVKDLKESFVNAHKEIIDIKKKKLLEEIGAERLEDGSYKLTSFSKLSDIIQREGIDREYPINTLLGLDLDENGDFKIPLTFFPNAGQIEPVITAIVSNRVAKLKLPGKSYIQGSEFVLKNNKGRVETDESIKDYRGIVWTKEEYVGTSKLKYPDASGNYAQIIMPFYFVKDGSKYDLDNFTKKENGRILLDTSKIDEELLQIMGFRIPYQGHNSGMWFEVIGFLPENAGDLILVPGEIAGQMGSDYDVDKLYSYNFNYYEDEKGKITKVSEDTTIDNLKSIVQEKRKLVSNTQRELISSGEAVTAYDARQLALGKLSMTEDDLADVNESDLTIIKAQNRLADITKAIFTADELKGAILDPLSFFDVQEAIRILGPEGTSTYLGTYDPIYQRDSYFSNRAGKDGTAISASANASHALAQQANLFIKGQGFMLADEEGNVYSDYTDINKKDTNSTAKLMSSTYYYSSKDDTNPGYMKDIEMVNANNPDNKSSWRLDKIYTHTRNPKTNQPYKISNLISQLLGVSVDNAKEQLLGKFGLNNQNFNTALAIVRGGFDLITVKAFLNQPILKEYYKAIENTEDIFDVDYTPNKRDAIVERLYNKYIDQFKLNTDVVTRENLNPLKINDLVRYSQEGNINAGNVNDQLEALKHFVKYKSIADALQSINSAFNIDTKGLPKNMSDTFNKVQDIGAASNNTLIGNIDLYRSRTIPGLFAGVPSMATDLFMNYENPMFAYNSPVYNNILQSLQLQIGRTSGFSIDQTDNFNNHVKQFVYSGFDSEHINPSVVREQFVFNGKHTSLVQDHIELIKKYPDNEFLQALKYSITDTVGDPELLEVAMSNEDNYVEKVTEYWEYALNITGESRSDLRDFAENMVDYALYVSPQEYGSSNIMKYVPFKYLEQRGFFSYLNVVHKDLYSEESTFPVDAFVRQFIQHNPDYLISAKETDFVPNSILLDRDAKTRRDAIINQFKVGEIGDPKNPSRRLLRMGLDGNLYYPTYVSVFNNEWAGKQIYEKLTNESGTYYYRIDKLGDRSMSEYSPGEYQVRSIVPSNISDIEETIDSSVISSKMGVPVIPTEGVPLNPNNLYDVEGATPTIPDLLDRITYNNNQIRRTTNNPIEKKYAEYYSYLANLLKDLDYSKFSLTLDENLQGSGRTIFVNNSIIINPVLSHKGNTGITPRLEQQRVLLHELIHAAYSGKNFASEEGKQLISVWEEYKKNLISSNKRTVRGINQTLFQAELFKLLVYNVQKSRVVQLAEDDVTLFTLQDVVRDPIANESKINKILSDLGERMNSLPDAPKVNYDLISNLERRAEFVNEIINFSANLSLMRNKYYGYTSVDEFITETATNNYTRTQLMKYPSLFEKFKTALMKFLNKLFGIEESERTLFNDAIEAVFNFVGVDRTNLNNTYEIDQMLKGPEGDETDNFTYDNKSYKILRDSQGIGYEIDGFDGTEWRKNAILDAYNTNRNIDPITGINFRLPTQEQDMTFPWDVDDLVVDLSMTSIEANRNNPEVQFTLDAIRILNTDKAETVFSKAKRNGWDITKIMNELFIPKVDKLLVAESYSRGNTNPKDIAIDIASRYSYSVEINTTKANQETAYYDEDTGRLEGGMYERDSDYYSNLTVPGGTNYTENEISTPLITPGITGHAQFSTDQGIGWFRSDDKSINGELVENIPQQFDEEGLPYFDSKTTSITRGGTPTKTRRILEVQSDLFQKGRSRSNLISRNTYTVKESIDFDSGENGWAVIQSYTDRSGYTSSNRISGLFTTKEEAENEMNRIIKSNEETESAITSNNFLQLLNKENNWIAFFIKSIIQDSVKKGYEKVLFPKGDTASKIEGHTTLEEFKREKEDRIKTLSKEIEDNKRMLSENIDILGNPMDEQQRVGYRNQISQKENEINQLRQEIGRVEREGFGALRPIYNFYENTVTNILNKQFGKDNVVEVTDEYGNKWNEIAISNVISDQNNLPLPDKQLNIQNKACK